MNEEVIFWSNPHVKRYKDSNQDRWVQFSSETIIGAANLLENGNICEIFKFLGEARQKIAAELRHGEENGRTDMFGKGRVINYGAYIQENIDETFSTGEIRGVDEKIYHKVKENIFCGINDGYLKKYSNTVYTFNFSAKFAGRLGLGLKNWTKPGILAYINESFISIYFYYPQINFGNFDNQNETLQRLQNYLDDILTKNYQSHDELLQDLGKLSFHIYRSLPFRLGTSGITDWLIRAVAIKKGVLLGPPNEDRNDLDWEAFFTFAATEQEQEEKYSAWFAKNAYQWTKEFSLSLDQIKANEQKAENSKDEIEPDNLRNIIEDEEINQLKNNGNNNFENIIKIDNLSYNSEDKVMEKSYNLEDVQKNENYRNNLKSEKISDNPFSFHLEKSGPKNSNHNSEGRKENELKKESGLWLNSLYFSRR